MWVNGQLRSKLVGAISYSISGEKRVHVRHDLSKLCLLFLEKCMVSLNSIFLKLLPLPLRLTFGSVSFYGLFDFILSVKNAKYEGVK